MTDRATPAPRRLDHVASEFEPHNLALQALLGLLGVGERLGEQLGRLPRRAAVIVEPGQHPLDLALLGLLGLSDAAARGLAARGLAPREGPTPSEPAEASEPAEPDELRRLLR